jgi:hypothetical protein
MVLLEVYGVIERMRWIGTSAIFKSRQCVDPGITSGMRPRAAAYAALVHVILSGVYSHHRILYLE